MNSSNEDLIVKFGVITDVQYANIDNRQAWYNQNKTRYYRDSLIHLKKAFNYWNSLEQKPTFVLQLGDLIDGLNTQEVDCNSLLALEQTIQIFENYPHIPTFHAVGNHELYNFSRPEIASLFRESLINRVKINPQLVNLELDFHDLTDEEMLLYYKFKPHPQIKVIALDCFDISVIGHHKESNKYRKAKDLLYQAHNHCNFDLWDLDTNLIDFERRFQLQNGGLSDNQLNWLKNELEQSQKNNEKVIIFGHVCLHPKSCDASCLLYNYDEVIELFNQFQCIICYLSGHAHHSGYAYESGIHYIVLHGIIETHPSSDAFTTITIKKNEMIVQDECSQQELILSLRKDQMVSSSDGTDRRNSDDNDLLSPLEEEAITNEDQLVSTNVEVLVQI